MMLCYGYWLWHRFRLCCGNRLRGRGKRRRAAFGAETSAGMKLLAAIRTIVTPVCTSLWPHQRDERRYVVERFNFADSVLSSI